MYELTILRDGKEYHSIYATNDHPMIVADISEEGKFYDPEKAYECKVEDIGFGLESSLSLFLSHISCTAS